MSGKKKKTSHKSHKKATIKKSFLTFPQWSIYVLLLSFLICAVLLVRFIFANKSNVLGIIDGPNYTCLRIPNQKCVENTAQNAVSYPVNGRGTCNPSGIFTMRCVQRTNYLTVTAYDSSGKYTTVPAGGSIKIYGSSNKLLGSISNSQGWAGNVAFGAVSLTVTSQGYYAQFTCDNCQNSSSKSQINLSGGSFRGVVPEGKATNISVKFFKISRVR